MSALDANNPIETKSQPGHQTMQNASTLNPRVRQPSTKVALLAGAVLLTAGGAAMAQENASPGEAVSCKPIRTAAQLNAIRRNLKGSYCLLADIDLGTIANFVPIGTPVTPFTGKLLGNNHVISNLKINSSAPHLGLFGYARGATFQDLGLINVNVTSTFMGAVAGGLAGFVVSIENGAGIATIKRVFTTGQVRCTGPNCYAGGIAGEIFNDGGAVTVSESWSSAKVDGRYIAGGAVGYATSSSLSRTYATGAVSCTQPGGCYAGGLSGAAKDSSVIRSFATGAAAGTDASLVGGLSGYFDDVTLKQSFATGPVSGLNDAQVGGLIGQCADTTASEVYAAGHVRGGVNAMTGGLIGVQVAVAVTYAYWDTATTGQATSAGGYGTGKTTKQLRAALPAGFGNAWGITKRLSYPFLNDARVGFDAPLATLVADGNSLAGFDLLYTFLPISQRVPSEYLGTPTHADEASLAAVYTMIARTIGATKEVAPLKGVKINKYFWKDRTRTVIFAGPVTDHVSLGQLVPLGPNTVMTNANVIGRLNQQRPVILRGTYTKSGGSTAKHWMLATLYTRNPDNTLKAVVAHDPWTGRQVSIDPKTKKVVAPARFPLPNFKVDGYQPVGFIKP